MSKEDRETIINKSEADETWNVYTSSPAMMTRLDKWAKAVDVQRIGGKIVSKEYDLPKTCVLIRKPPKKRRRPDLIGTPILGQKHVSDTVHTTLSNLPPIRSTPKGENGAKRLTSHSGDMEAMPNA